MKITFTVLVLLITSLFCQISQQDKDRQHNQKLPQIDNYEHFQKSLFNSCFNECNSSCGFLCRGQIAINGNFDECERFINLETEQVGLSYYTGAKLRHELLCYDENIYRSQLGVESTNFMKCRTNCISQGVEQFNVYTPGEFEDKNQGRDDDNLQPGIYISQEDFQQCGTECLANCQGDCSDNIYDTVDYLLCQDLYRQVLAEQSSGYGNRYYLGYSTANMYRECIQKNKVLFDVDSNEFKTMDCEEVCVESLIDDMKDTLRENCKDKTCFSEVLMCLQECEIDHCNELKCLETSTNTDLRLHMFSTCLGLQQALSENSLALRKNPTSPIPIQIAGELVSCAKLQEEDQKKLKNEQAAKMFGCAKMCANEHGSVLTASLLIIMLGIISLL